MAPKTPAKTSTKNRKHNESTAPKPSASNPANVSHVNYAEVQAEEIDVLQAIYMDDYEEVEIKTAWSKSSDRAFKLTLKAFSDESTFVLLSAQLTATYPKSAPVLQIEGLDKLQAQAKKRISNIVKTRPAEMVGEVMIHAIASDIQDALEDAVQAREQGVLPSLEDERMNQRKPKRMKQREYRPHRTKKTAPSSRWFRTWSRAAKPNNVTDLRALKPHPVPILLLLRTMITLSILIKQSHSDLVWRAHLSAALL
jgi:translation initiation factor 2-alpha kinase 4